MLLLLLLLLLLCMVQCAERRLHVNACMFERGQNIFGHEFEAAGRVLLCREPHNELPGWHWTWQLPRMS